MRGPLDVGRALRDGQLLAIDPATAPALVRYPPGDAASSLPPLLARLADERPATQAIELPADVRRLAITIDADIRPDPGFDPDADFTGWEGMDASVVVEDGDGRLHRITGGSGLFMGSGQRLVIPLTQVVNDTTVAFPGPVRLQGVELSLHGPAGSVGIGTVDILGLDSSATDAGDADWTDTGWQPTSPSWQWSSVRGGDQRSLAGTPGQPNRITFGHEPGQTEALFGNSSAVIRSSTLPDAAELVPAVVSDRFLELSGAVVGDEVAASVAGQRLTLRIIGSTTQFPSLDPAKGFGIVDATTLERARLATTGQLIATREWWLSVDDAAALAVEDALRQAPVSAVDVIGRVARTRSLGGDPISLGIIGALGLGALAALAFAAIGFIVSATVTTSERITEFAILRALGLSGRELAAWVSLENAFLLIFGLVAGSALGLVLAWLVLPFATLTETGAAAVPTPEIVVPWLAILPIYAAALVLFIVTVVIVTRQVRRAGITTVLRSGDE